MRASLLRRLYDAMREPLVVDCERSLGTSTRRRWPARWSTRDADCEALPLVRALVPPFQQALAP